MVYSAKKTTKDALLLNLDESYYTFFFIKKSDYIGER